jgi:hypothetical protein
MGLEASALRVEEDVTKSAQEYEEISNVAFNGLKLEEQYGILNFLPSQLCEHFPP